MLYTFHGFKFLVDPFTEPSRSSAQSKQLFALYIYIFFFNSASFRFL
jgi:hypothetical protein